MIDPITEYILNEISFGKNKSRFKGEELYHGLEFSVKEFQQMIGGISEFKKILKVLKSIIDDDIKDSRKKGYEIPKPPIEYVPDDYARISTTGDKGSLYIQYTLNGNDSTGHGMAATWQLEFKLQKSYGEAASGWDG